MGPWNRPSGVPREVGPLIDGFRVVCCLGVAAVGGYHLAVGIVGGRNPLGPHADDIVMAPMFTCRINRRMT
jgi:hypothetical protein